MKSRVFAAVCALSMAFLATGCASRTSVSRLLRDPNRYQNRQVTVQGRVTGSVNALVAGGYRVDDGTGTITVISNGGAPREGDSVRVTGRVQSGLSVFGQSFGTTLRETDRRVRP